MKSLYLASALAAVISFAIPTAVEAKTNVKIYLGLPHYGYQVGPDYRYRNGYGWYLPSGIHGRLSCGEAKARVRDHGFRNVSTIECDGRTYTFRARRGDHRIIVYVNSRSGSVWRG